MKTAIKNEGDTHGEMECWEIAKRPSSKKVVHTKFELSTSRDEKEDVCNYNTGLLEKADIFLLH